MALDNELNSLIDDRIKHYDEKIEAFEQALPEIREMIKDCEKEARECGKKDHQLGRAFANDGVHMNKILNMSMSGSLAIYRDMRDNMELNRLVVRFVSQQTDTTSSQVREEFLSELHNLKSRYDVSHEGIMRHLEDLKKRNAELNGGIGDR